MSYVNFKEEVYVAKIQLQKRINNNEMLFNKITKEKNIGNNYNPNEKYSFKEFNDESRIRSINKENSYIKGHF